MGVCLSLPRFRAKSFPLLVLVRKFAAWCLSRRIFPAIRWIPSERNSADAPSICVDYLYRDEPKYANNIVEPTNTSLSNSTCIDSQRSSLCSVESSIDKGRQSLDIDSNGDCDISQHAHSCKVEESSTHDCDSSRHAHSYVAADSNTRPQDPAEAAAPEVARAEGEGIHKEAPSAPTSVGSKRSVSRSSHFRALRIVASKVFSKQVAAAVIARLPQGLSIESSPFASVWIAFYSEVRSVAAWVLIHTLAQRLFLM